MGDNGEGQRQRRQGQRRDRHSGAGGAAGGGRHRRDPHRAVADHADDVERRLHALDRVEVLDRVVLGRDREAIVFGRLGNALRHGPRGEHAVALEAKVVVEPPGVVPLHDEDGVVFDNTAAGKVG